MKLLVLIISSAVILMALVLVVDAHCDSLAGPVVQSARLALRTGDVTPVLKWIRPQDEPVVIDAFEHAKSVRSLGDEARELADTYFFETVVRIHRAGEGAPYTGLKDEGSAEPGILLADAALESGDPEKMLADLTKLVREGTLERFMQVVRSREDAERSVALGRDYVEAYVTFIHYVEALHHAAVEPPAHAAHAEPSTH